MKKRISGLSIIGFALMFTLLASCGKKDEARTIKAEKINGTVTAATEKKTVDVKKGEQLKSGQTISVESGSDLTLLLDADKHVYAEENSVFNLVAKGYSGKTKTKIVMESGKIQYDIDKKLKDKETFEVSTPNATMSVRGTSFIVEISGEGENGVTKIIVEKGSIQVITEVDGVEVIETLTAGTQKTYDGVCPGYELKGNSGNDSSKKREGYGPQVLSITYDSNGQEVKEYFNFFETYPEFTDNTLKPWILDLMGQTVELEEVWTLNTDVSIQNGTIKTSKDAYIENKGTLHFGFDYSGNKWTTLEANGVGIENKGTLHLRSGKFIIESGAGIHNTGELLPEYTDEAKDRFDTSYEPEVTVNAGTFINNDGLCILDGAVITGSNEGLVINNKEMFLLENFFYGNAPGYVVNNDIGTLWSSNTILNIDDDSAVGLKNYGTFGIFSDFDKYTNTYMSTSYPMIFKITKGTGIINKGIIRSSIKIYMSGGLGVDNFGTMYPYDNSYGELKANIEGGLLLHNEQGATALRAEAYVMAGQVILNEGNLGTNDNEAYVLFDFKAVCESYSGTMVLNEKTGVMKGHYRIACTGLENSTLIDNKGTVEANDIGIATGFKLLNLEDWTDWHDPSNDWWLASADPRPEYAIDQAVSVKNSVAFNDEGTTDIGFAIHGMVFGTGSGKYEFYRPTGSSKHYLGTLYLLMYGSNATGVYVGEGVDVSLYDWEVYIGKAEDGAAQQPVNEWIYYNHEYEFDRENCSGNYGIYNKGNIGLGVKSAGQHEIVVRGSENVGLYNEGFMEICPYAWVFGHKNVGFDNPGSISNGTVSAVVAEIGGNVGLRNSGIIKDCEIRINDFSYYNYSEQLYQSPESAYGKDVGFYNTATGIVDSPTLSFSVYNFSEGSYGLINEYQIKAGLTSFSTVKGTGGVLGENSLTQISRLQCTNFTYGSENYRDSHTYNGTILSISGQVELSGDSSEKDSRGNSITGRLDVSVIGSGSTGIHIATGGSLYQICSEGYKDYYGGEIESRNNGMGIINEGHLHLDHPGFKIVNSSGYTKCLADRGTFTFTPFEERIKNGYGKKGCPGPWYGAEYSEINN
ncbi:MAG: FecR family protein [Lachnospiraceae bacterium]|nr:FecR family protein [Lachnospiraceae bacterium]